jgi:hypothetical protein
MSFFKRLFGTSKNTENQPESTASKPKKQPTDLLNDVFWNLAGSKYDDVASFAKDLIDYNNEVNPKNDIDVYRIFNTSTKITVQYMFWGEDEDGDEDQIEEDFLVETTNSKGFTVVEFLYQVHNQICEQMMEEEATYFEGLLPFDGDTAHPSFHLQQGS